jgi:putative oxidoreductase
MTHVTVVDPDTPNTRSVAALIAMCLPRIIVALLFLYVGLDKFAGTRVWVRIFDTIGIGQWLRYLTGFLQIGGAILVLVPRTFRVGIALLACTMLGACIAWLTVLHAPQSAVIPGTLLLILVAVGLVGRSRR